MSEQSPQTEQQAEEKKEEEQEETEQPNQANESPETTQESEGIWPQLRQLLIFQVKLYVDALRDILMSPLSVVVFIIDVVQGNKGENSLFESLLRFGRKTEHAINLFNQHDATDEGFKGIDTVIAQVEESVRKEYKDGSVSSNAKEKLDESLDKLRKKVNKTRNDQNEA